MIRQITTILGCALLGFGLACADNDAEGTENNTCRELNDVPGDSEQYTCGESTPCETLPAGSAYGTCSSIDGCTKQGEPIEISGTTITAYTCTGTRPAE